MTDDRYIITKHDLGYLILPNGDFVTSDGLPRDGYVADDGYAMLGKPLNFRTPTDQERDQINGTNDLLVAAFRDFASIQDNTASLPRLPRAERRRREKDAK